MQRIHLLRVEAPPAAFALLFTAASARRERIGWLDLGGVVELGAAIGEAAASGARPAVTVGDGQVVAVRVMKGEPVLRDLLRRDFLGCRAVLVRGDVEAPLLAPEAGSWRTTPRRREEESGADAPGPEPGSRSWTSEELLDALRRPRPWG